MNTISNEVLEKLSVRYRLLAKIHDGNESQAWEENALIVEELLALRKEREAAVPFCEVKVTHLGTDAWAHSVRFADKKPPAGAHKLYTAPPAQPVAVPEFYGPYTPAVIGAGVWVTITDELPPQLEGREVWVTTAPPAPPVADDSLPFDPQIAEYEQMMEAELKAPARTAYKVKSELSQMAEKLVRDTTALAATLSAETDTTAQQFESLAGKAVGGSDGFEYTPVADLYELLTKCGECYDYTTSEKVAAAWIKDGYSAREYVKLDRLQEAMTQGSSGEADSWIPCSERMPVEKDIVLVVDDGYFVCEAQYREGDFFSAARGNNEFFETICRDVEFWQPLPEPPCK
ncbi:DUF551 domain-containing protein [Cronobacter turicensis]